MNAMTRKLLAIRDDVIIMQDAHAYIVDFMTPSSFAGLMVSLSTHVAREAGLILEPSAGTGNIVEAMVRKGIPKSNIIAVERSPELADMLREKDLCAHVYCADFVQVGTRYEGRYVSGAGLVCREHGFVDTVIMNPPFDEAGAFNHIYAASSVLAERGTLVTTIPGGLDWTYGPNASFKMFLKREFQSHNIIAVGPQCYYDHHMSIGVDVDLVVAHGRKAHVATD